MSDAAVPDVPGAAVPDVLAAAALATFERVMAGSQSRGDALRLLAADALLTYAFEASTELGRDPGELAERLGPAGLLGERLARAVGEAESADG